MVNPNFAGRPERRSFLLRMVSAAAAAATLPVVRALAAVKGPTNGSSVYQALGEIFEDRRAAGQIGHRYLVLYPEDAVRLAHLFRKLWDAYDSGGAKALHQSIAALRSRDFASDDVVIVDGWVIARTEGMLCALVHRV